MSKIPPKPPVSSGDVPDAWIEIVQDILRQQPHPLRGPGEHPIIEIQSLTDHVWHPLAMPTGGVVFTDVNERDIVLMRIRTPIRSQQKPPTDTKVDRGSGGVLLRSA